MNEPDNKPILAPEGSAPPLSDFERAKITRVFKLFLIWDQRRKEQDDLRTDRPE